LLRGGKLGLGLGASGASLLFQGGSGVSPLYKLLGMNRAVHSESAAISVPHQQGRHVSASITINRPVEEVYAFWRDFTNLPTFMPALKSVDIQSDRRSHWVYEGPGGKSLEWDAEIVNEERNVVIGWRSLENSYLHHAGSARFKPAMGGQGTEVRVEMEYLPLGGAVGMALANIMRLSPENQLSESLKRLKQLLETGEISNTDGQSSGRSNTGD
jgi:uncharacterized membrane protein